jgi:hypothetical protein
MDTYFQQMVDTSKSCDMKKMLTIAALVIPFISKGQTILRFRTGIASYTMSDLKSIQQSQQSSFQVPAKTLSSFPNYYYYGVGVDNVGRNFVTGLHLNFGSTGGRVYYSDYSGVVGSDQRLTYTDLSGMFGYFFGRSDSKFRIGLSLNTGILLGNTTIHDYLNVTGYANNYDYSYAYKNFNFFIQPNLNLQYNLGPLVLGTSVGYNLNAINSKLSNDGGQLPYKADFSGLRANVSLGLALTKNETDESQLMPDISIGYGLDHGGIGANILFHPSKNVGLFTGLGYAFAGVGVNGGFKFTFDSKNGSKNFFVTAMYGYNTAVYVSNQTSLNAFFYGPSFGFGFDRLNQKGNVKYSYQLIIPIRGSDATNYVNYLKASGVSFSNFLSPVLISFGRRINFRK